MIVSPKAKALAQDLLDFIDASPSPWHVAAEVVRRLEAEGFDGLQEAERWRLQPGGRYYVIRGGSSVIAFVTGKRTPDLTGFRIVGAHTDSPGLRLKPRAPHAADFTARLGVEVYGGAIIASFSDRDLGLAGRISLRGEEGPSCRLLRFDKPLVRLPNLAIHMNRNVNEDGLKFNKQTELPLLFANIEESSSPREHFLSLIAREVGVASGEILNWEFNVYDTQKGVFWGPSEEFIADSQLDNLASCHAALCALVSAKDPEGTCVCALFDHEEVGSESAKGAASVFLASVLERISGSLDRESHAQAVARSFLVSADMAHAYHPNFPGAYEPLHQIRVNAGPVIKTNANQRYVTDAHSEAYFMDLCERVGVPWQQYAHRTDLGCGSTIGPIVAARLGLRAVDVGNPMWAMHSARESAGAVDHELMVKVLTAFLA